MTLTEDHTEANWHTYWSTFRHQYDCVRRGAESDRNSDSLWRIIPLRQSPLSSHAQPKLCCSIELRASAIACHRPRIGKPFLPLNNRKLQARKNSQPLRGSA